MSRVLRTMSVAVAAAAIVTACGGDDEPEAQAAPPVPATTDAPAGTQPPITTQPPSTTQPPTATQPPATAPPTTVAAGARPVYPGILEPDTYANKKFALPLTFTIENEWDSMESSKSLLFYRQPVEGSDFEPGELALLLDADGLGVEEVVEKLRTNPGITFGEPEPATIAGLEGLVVSAEPTAEEVDFDWMIDGEMGGNWYSIPGVQHEVYVVDHAGTTIMIWIDSHPEIWDQFRAEVQTVLDSVTWGE